jgi:hypothetical protein
LDSTRGRNLHHNALLGKRGGIILSNQQVKLDSSGQLWWPGRRFTKGRWAAIMVAAEVLVDEKPFID